MNDKLPTDLPLQHPIRQVPTVPFGPSQGITVLGVPCDAAPNGAHTSQAWRKCVDGTLHTLEKLRRFPDSQIKHCLMRYCLDACKVNHLLRTTPASVGLPFMTELSDALKSTLCDLLGSGISNVDWEQATLPVRQGGLSIKDPSKCGLPPV